MLWTTPVTAGTPISLPVAAGKRSNGEYVLTVPESGRSKLAVDVALGTDRDHAQFLGSVR